MPRTRPRRSIAMTYRLALAFLLLVAFFLRVYHLTSAPPGLHFDEAVYGLQALEIVHGARPVFFPSYTGREPLYMYVMALIFGGVGASAWTIRLTSAFIGVATVAMSATWARRLYGRFVGVAAAGLLTVHYWHLTVSRNGYPNVLIPPLEAASAYFLWRGLERGRWRDWLVGGGLVGLALYTYLAARFWPVAVGVILIAALVVDRQRLASRWRGLVTAAAATALVFAPLALYFAAHPADFLERANQVLAWRQASGRELIDLLVANARRTAMAFFVEGQGDPRWHYNLPGRPLFFAPVSWLWLLGLAVCLRRARDLRYLLLLIWVVVTCLPGILTAEMQPAGQRIFGMFPALVAIPAVGFSVALAAAQWLADRVGARWPSLARGRWTGSGDDGTVGTHSSITTRRPPTDLPLSPIALVVLIAVLAIDGARTWHDYFDDWAKQPATYHIFNSDYAALARLARADIATGRTVVILSQHDKHPTVAFQAPETVDHAVWAEPLLSLPLPASRGLVTNTVIYYRVTSYLPDDSPAAALLERAAQDIQRAAGPGEVEGRPVDVVRYVVPRNKWMLLAAASPQAGGQASPPSPNDGDESAWTAVAELRCAGGLALNGERGQTFSLPVRWTVDRRPATGRRFAVHLVDGSGFTWAQADALGYLADEWHPGDEVVSWYDLKLARDMPPGDYEAKLIVTDEAGRPVDGATGEAEVGAIHVQPGRSKGLKDGQAVEHDFGAGLALVDHDAVGLEQAGGNRMLRLDLHWARVGTRTPPERFQLRLRDAAGKSIDLVPIAISDAYPPSAWEDRELLHGRYRLALPGSVGAGDFEVVLTTVGDVETREESSSTGGFPLGHVQIPPRAR